MNSINFKGKLKMKLVNIKTVAALVVAGFMSVGSASAMMLDNGNSPLNSVDGVSSANLTVNFKNGVATVFGDVDSGVESALAANYVADMDGVTRVVNLISVN